jgi:hypothetical protein
MSLTTDRVHEGHDQTAPASPDTWGPDGTMDALPETDKPRHGFVYLGAD